MSERAGVLEKTDCAVIKKFLLDLPLPQASLIPVEPEAQYW